MAEIYNFNNNNSEEESCCPFCDLTNEFVPYVKDCKSDEELFEVLRGLVSESSRLALMDFLEREIDNNIAILDHLAYGDSEE